MILGRSIILLQVNFKSLFYAIICDKNTLTTKSMYQELEIKGKAYPMKAANKNPFNLSHHWYWFQIVGTLWNWITTC